jgi:hypothetical protein
MFYYIRAGFGRGKLYVVQNRGAKFQMLYARTYDSSDQ